MLDLDLTRRDFIKTSGTVLMGTLATTTGVLSVLAPSKTWALELTKLDKTTGQIVLQATRHIFPHATLDDAVYALVCLLYTSPSPRDLSTSRMPSSA